MDLFFCRQGHVLIRGNVDEMLPVNGGPSLICLGSRHKNVIDSAQALLMAMRKLGVDPEEPNNRAHADRILEYRMDSEPLSVLPQEILQSVESLWHDPVIPSVMDRSSEFYLMDSATYFFANLRKIGAADYVPDEADVLRARTKTTGISETRFNMGQLSIHMFDVGGQRSERKKWIHCEYQSSMRRRYRASDADDAFGKAATPPL